MTGTCAATDTSAWVRYLDTRSEDAFTEVVGRHINLVYSVAIRRSGGDQALAQDIVQTVFTDLAQKAAVLPRNLELAGWLYRHSTFVAANLVRSEVRRRQRETVAMNLQNLDDPIDWSRIAPVLDDALSELPERDRIAIVLRFLDQQPFAEVGRALGIGSDAARMRVDRALDRLQEMLSRRGVASTAAALALVIGQHGVVAAPSTLAAAVAASSTLTTITLASTGFVSLMTTSKITFGVAAIVVATATTAAYLEHRENKDLRAELATIRTTLAVGDPTTEPSISPSTLEIDSLREDRVRLMALRDEVGRLREAQRRMSALEEENRALREAKASGQESSGEEKARDYQAEMEQGLALARMNFAKAWVVAFMNFAEEHGDQIPSSFQEATQYFPKDVATAASVLDPNRFEIVYQGSLEDIPNPATTIVVREREAFTAKGSDGTPVFMRTYGFADGHSELHTAPDGNFDDWERARTITSGELR